VALARNSTTSLIHRLDRFQISPGVTGALCQRLQSATNEAECRFLMDALKFMCSVPAHCEIVIQANLPFESLLLGTRIVNPSWSFHDEVAALILHMVPVSSHLKCLVEHLRNALRPEMSEEFARAIQPVVVSAMLEQPRVAGRMALLALIGTLEASRFEMTEQFIALLQGLAVNQLADCVICLLSYYPDCPFIRTSQILKSLNGKRNDDWYLEIYNRLALSSEGVDVQIHETLTPREIMDALDSKRVSGFQLITPSILSDFLNVIAAIQSRSGQQRYFEVLGRYVQQAVGLIPVQFIQKSMGVEDWVKCLARKTNIEIQTADNPSMFFDCIGSAPLNVVLARSQHFTVNNQALFKEYPMIERDFPQDYEKEITLIAWLANAPPALSLTSSKSIPIALNSSVFATACDLGILCKGETMVLKVATEPSPGPFVAKRVRNLQGRDLLHVLRRFHRMSGLTFVNATFTARVVDQLIHPFETLSRRSVILSIILTYPFLFPLEVKILAAKLASFDVISGTHMLFKQFGIRRGLDEIEYRPLKFVVNRELIFDDGVTLMTKFAKTFVPLRLRFMNESGVGPGPTKEFFTTFSREFTRRERNLFRSHHTESPDCVDPLGLFPAPNAFPPLFETLGILCAKTILMDCILDINFNPAFIQLLRGQIIDTVEVDLMLARSLLSSKGTESVDFTYPGYPEIELVPHGATMTVEPDRIEEYCALVREFTCGQQRFKAVRQAFLEGFNAIVPFQGFDCLTPEEFCTLISGQRTPFTEDELRACVDFSGFNVDSPVVEWFVRRVAKMSQIHQSYLLQFVTGFPQTPVGGLKAIQPRISVVHKGCELTPNSLLPTASTCSNQLKLPEYESEEMLLEKLTLAITEGRETFAWT
jgi:hypothetical protein